MAITMTEQLIFWLNEFGHEYMERNLPDKLKIAALTKAWARILNILPTNEINSILEVGCNVGLNLQALKLLTHAKLYGVEPFAKALNKCVENDILSPENAFVSSADLLDMFQDNQVDLVFTSGVLIHIATNDLKRATDNLIRVAKKYIVCIEYFSDREEEIAYRGHRQVLFKRDYGAFYLDNYNCLKLKDYGFFWKRATLLDNATWWLFEKM